MNRLCRDPIQGTSSGKAIGGILILISLKNVGTVPSVRSSLGIESGICKSIIEISSRHNLLLVNR